MYFQCVFYVFQCFSMFSNVFQCFFVFSHVFPMSGQYILAFFCPELTRIENFSIFFAGIIGNALILAFLSLILDTTLHILSFFGPEFTFLARNCRKPLFFSFSVAFFFDFGHRGALNKPSKPGLPRFCCVALLRPDARITKCIWICFGNMYFEMCGICFHYEFDLARKIIILLLVWAWLGSALLGLACVGLVAWLGWLAFAALAWPDGRFNEWATRLWPTMFQCVFNMLVPDGRFNEC